MRAIKHSILIAAGLLAACRRDREPQASSTSANLDIHLKQDVYEPVTQQPEVTSSEPEAPSTWKHHK